jgi:hypothetical protein
VFTGARSMDTLIIKLLLKGVIMETIPWWVSLIILIVGLGWALFPYMLCGAINNIADAIRYSKEKNE